MLYHWLLLKMHYTGLFNGLEHPVAGFVGFWGALLVLPAAILIGGRYYARHFNPRSRFGAIAVTLSGLAAAINPLVITCWSLSLAGGACT